MFEKPSVSKLTPEDYSKKKKEMEIRLGNLQRQITEKKIPVIILFEGFSASGKGTAISSLILNLDPRGFEVHTTRKPNETEARFPWLQRFAVNAPAKGRIEVFDRAWYSALNWMEEGKKDVSAMKPYFRDIETFERQLTDDGVVIIKFFLYIPKKELQKRISKLEDDKNTSWRVAKEDLKQLKNYDQDEAFYTEMITDTDTPNAPWHVVYAKDKRYTRAQVMDIVADSLEKVLAQPPRADIEGDIHPKIASRFTLLPAPRIEDVQLNQTMDEQEYRTKLDALQKELSELHNIIYRKKIPVVIAFEGNDAAGKGGSIRRTARALDPRGYTVNPIAGPTPAELSHNHLWRFYTRLPRTGHVGIFDRTWYGRVLVERVEGLTPKYRIEQAYEEIDEFEYMLHEWGAIIVKFWLAIDQDEQLKRFKAREHFDPDEPGAKDKRWKLTDEDWRNRDKWDLYVQAVNDMIKYTNTSFAPWTIVEANSKYFARIKVLETVVNAIKARLAEASGSKKNKKNK